MQVGDKVICIKNDFLNTIEVGKEYLITNSSCNINTGLSVGFTGSERMLFPSEYFVTKIEYRRIKLEKLKINIMTLKKTEQVVTPIENLTKCLDCNWEGDIKECAIETEFNEFRGNDMCYPVCPKCGGGVVHN